MTTLTVSEARSRLYRLLDEMAESHEPVQIAGRRSSAVLVSEEDWRAIQETLYLLSIPGMRQSIRKGLRASLRRCTKQGGVTGCSRPSKKALKDLGRGEECGSPA